MFKQTLYSEKFIINAPIEEVWEVIANLDNYPQWNPFTVKVIGKLELGHPVDLHVHMPIRGDRVSTEYVEILEKPHTLGWGMKMLHPFFLKARRDQHLIKIDDQQCSYQTWDAFQGILTPIVTGLFRKDIVGGFNAVGKALQEKFEN